MSNEEIYRRTRELRDLVVQSCTRLNYLLQINELAREKNGIIFRHQSFWAQIQGDFSDNAILSVRRLIENDKNTHNIGSYILAIKLHEDYGTHKKKINYYSSRLTKLAKLKIAKDSKILASIQHAHKQLYMPSKVIEIKYKELFIYLTRVGKVINQISNLYWGNSVVLHQSESEGDSFIKEYRHMEIAELAGSHLIRLDKGHTAVKYAQSLISDKY